MIACYFIVTHLQICFFPSFPKSFSSTAPAPLLGPATATLTLNKQSISLKAANLAVLVEPLVDITTAAIFPPFTLAG
jgi:hypothetical protein